MKKQMNTTQSLLIMAFVLLIFSGCERELSEDAVFATFPNTAEVFTDVPVGLTDEFFISFDPAGGANTDGFGTDENEVYDGTTSIRIDVPASNDPNGNFIGGIFKDRGQGRNLSEFNVLTFWAKGSASGTLGLVGFGDDFESSTYTASLNNLQLTTDWKKYFIPIPNPSRLTQEKGMFIFSAGGLDVVDNIPNGNEIAWTFWMDEIRFESLGAIGDVQPSIMNGADVVQDTFIGVNTAVTNLASVFNVPSGDVSVNTSPSYFEFTSSNPTVATVNQLGEVTVLSAGTTTITAIVDGVAAEGSLTLNSLGTFVSAPVPTRPAANVTSVFSNAYPNVPVGFYNGFFGGQTTLGGLVDVGSDQIISYTDLNYVAIGIDGTIDVSNRSYIHLDIQVDEPLDAGDNLILELGDFGPNGAFGGGDDTAGGHNISGSQLTSGSWVGIDIALNDFPLGTGGGGQGNPNLNNIAQIIFVSPNISDITVDNIYFYNE